MSATGMEDEGSRIHELQQQQPDQIEKAINEIKLGKHGRITNVHKMREVVAGQKKQQQEAHTVQDSKTGKTVLSIEEIKPVHLKHCLEVLKNNVPKPEIVPLLNFQSDLHDLMMNEHADEDTNIMEEEFNETVTKFKLTNKKNMTF